MSDETFPPHHDLPEHRRRGFGTRGDHWRAEALYQLSKDAALVILVIAALWAISMAFTAWL